MNKGVYLIQPSELIETNRYKFGMSNKDIINRIKSYGSDTKQIYILYTIIPKNIENLLKIIFKNHIFTKREYIKFDDYNSLKILFYKCIISFNVLYKFINKINYKVIYFTRNFSKKNNKLIKENINNKIIINKKINQNLNYICLRCNKEYNNKRHFEKHLLRKFPCNVINIEIDNDKLLELLYTEEYIDYFNSLMDKKQCIHCKKLYSKNNLKRHQQICLNEINSLKYKNIDEINPLNYENIEGINYNEINLLEENIFNKLSIKDKNENISNILINIMDELYKNHSNINFKLLNQKEGKYIVKLINNIEVIFFNELFMNINNIITNIYKKIVIDTKKNTLC